MIKFRIRKKYAFLPKKVFSYEQNFEKCYFHFILFGEYYVVEYYNPIKRKWEDKHHNLLHKTDAEYYRTLIRDQSL